MLQNELKSWKSCESLNDKGLVEKIGIWPKSPFLRQTFYACASFSRLKNMFIQN